jgi:cation diffusion facilitator CzcD-associated flavoprotein CzcO
MVVSTCPEAHNTSRTLCGIKIKESFNDAHYGWSMSENNILDAIVIGAGFSGIYQLHCLRDRLGLKAKLLEAGDGVGGTWYWNRYPGARCDSESHSYMYYFSDELVQEWEWSERYPQQPEILRYLNHVADKLDLKKDMSFNTRVCSAQYDESQNQWVVRTQLGDTWRAQFLITAVGCLSSANVPDIMGRDDFAGQWFHTGSWPQEGVDFKGKRVGVVGTGSTGIQVIPVIAQQAAHLTVFQRTANYSLPANNAPLTEEFKQYAKVHAHDIYEIMTTNHNGHPFHIESRTAVETPEQERQQIYEAAWNKGGLRFRATFEDLLTDQRANETAAQFIRQKILQIVKDPEKAEILADIDHPFAAKRPPIDSGYFETYNRDNVSIVNLRRTPIEEIVPEGIRTSNRTYDLDVIVFATGFDAMTGSLLKLNIEGVNGRKLTDDWRAGPQTYLGLQIPGYPNLFTITGPGSPSVLCNLPPAIEQHVQWITNCIKHMKEHQLVKVQTSDAVSQQWQAEVDRAANATLLPQVKHSWYLGANVPGKPRVFMPYAGGLAHYRSICDAVAADNYRGFQFS